MNNCQNRVNISDVKFKISDIDRYFNSQMPLLLHKRAKKGNYTNKEGQDILILIQLEQFTQYKNANGASQLYTSTIGRY